MLKQDDLFDVCARRHRGNAVSSEANLVTRKSRDRSAILGYLRTVPDATCDEIEVALGMNHQTASARMSELKMAGEIVATGKRPTRTGCAAQAWRINRKG